MKLDELLEILNRYKEQFGGQIKICLKDDDNALRVTLDNPLAEYDFTIVHRKAYNQLFIHKVVVDWCEQEELE